MTDTKSTTGWHFDETVNVPINTDPQLLEIQQHRRLVQAQNIASQAQAKEATETTTINAPSRNYLANNTALYDYGEIDKLVASTAIDTTADLIASNQHLAKSTAAKIALVITFLILTVTGIFVYIA